MTIIRFIVPGPSSVDDIGLFAADGSTSFPLVSRFSCCGSESNETDESAKCARENSLSPYAEQKVHIIVVHFVSLLATHFGGSVPLCLFIALRRSYGRNCKVRR